jgi:hypothetical protein
VESSVFGANLVVVKNGIETCCELCYKLRMMGVPLSGPIYVYGNNVYVIQNTQSPEYVFNNRSNLIHYHAVHESAEMADSIIDQLPSVDNPSDICTKIVPGFQKHHNMARILMNDLCETDLADLCEQIKHCATYKLAFFKVCKLVPCILHLEIQVGSSFGNDSCRRSQ